LVASLKKLGLDGKTLIVDSFDNENLILSTRNLQRAKVVSSFGLNIYDLLFHEKLVLSREAAKELEGLLGPRQNTAAAEAAPEENAEAEQARPAKSRRARKPKQEETA
jgi:large subunit ribosomal protein L4